MESNRDVTIYDIAKTLDISASTVSRGLKDHPHVREGLKLLIRQTAKQLGYQQNRFASNLRKRQSLTLGAIIPRLNSYFMSAAISGMERIANESGYHLIISQSQEHLQNEISAIQALFNARVDGLLVSLSAETNNLDHFEPVFHKEIPVVFFDRVLDHPQSINVVIDNYLAGYQATDHLIAMGCKQIIHLGGPLLSNVYSERYRGFQQAMKDHGLPMEENALFVDELNYHSAARVVQQILDRNPVPDGIFTANDSSAVALMGGLLKAGIRVPRDVCIVGFNDDPVAQVIEPDLTTIQYPAAEMGAIAAATLIELLKGRRSEVLKTIVLSHSLVERNSSCPRNIAE